MYDVKKWSVLCRNDSVLFECYVYVCAVKMCLKLRLKSNKMSYDNNFFRNKPKMAKKSMLLEIIVIAIIIMLTIAMILLF